MSSRPRESASMMCAPHSRSMAAAVDLPLPRLPVRPTRNIFPLTSAKFGGADGVGHEHSNCERAYAAGDRSVGTGLHEGLGVNVADNYGAAFLDSGLALGVAGEIAFEFFARGDAV